MFKDDKIMQVISLAEIKEFDVECQNINGLLKTLSITYEAYCRSCSYAKALIGTKFCTEGEQQKKLHALSFQDTLCKLIKIAENMDSQIKKDKAD